MKHTTGMKDLGSRDSTRWVLSLGLGEETLYGSCLIVVVL